MTTETKRDLTAIRRDLAADLVICDAATAGPWRFTQDKSDRYDEGKFVTDADNVRWEAICHFGDSTQFYPTNGESPVEEDCVFIAEARTGWPHAIKRAMAAEAEVERLRAVIDSVLYTLDTEDFTDPNVITRGVQSVLINAMEVPADATRKG